MKLYERSYPFLRLMYDTMETAPVNQYMASPDEHARAFTLQCPSFLDLLAYFPAAKSIQPSRTFDVHYLSPDLFRKIDSDESIRGKYFNAAMKQLPTVGCGIILMPNGGQYLYLYLPEAESQQLKSVNGRYIATALFMGNCFLGFEEGIFSRGLVKNQLAIINHTAYYSIGMDPGGYLSFLLTFLGHKQAKGPFLNKLDTDTPCTIWMAG